MQQSFFKRNTQNIWIILAFLLISLMYCLPQLQGKKLSVHDTISWESMAHETLSYNEATGKQALWSNSMFGGMPVYTYAMEGVKNFIVPVQINLEKILSIPAAFFFYAMLCFFILCNSLKIDKWLGAIGAIAYAFASYNAVIISAGHNTKMFSIGFLPCVLAGFIMIFNGRRLIGAAILAFFFTLMLSWAHYQMIYYTGILLLFAGISIAIQEIKKGNYKNLVISGLVAVGAMLLSFGPSLPSVLTTAEYTKYTMRGGASELKQLKGGAEKKSGGLDREYAYRWSNDIGETFCLLIPQLYGGSSGQNIGTDSKYYETLTSIGVPEASAEQMAEQAPTYWGTQPFLSGPVFFGAIVCFLFVLGMMVIESPNKWWIFSLSLIAILMSLGKNLPALNNFLFDHLPLYNKFRVPSMILVLPQLLFPFLGIWALNDILKDGVNKEALWKKIKMATIITAGLCLLIAIGSNFLFDFKSAGDAQLAEQFTKSANNNAEIGQKIVKAIMEDRASMAMRSGFYSAFLIVAVAGLLWAFLNNKLKKQMVIAGIAFLVAIDLIPTAHTYLNDKNYVDASDYENQFTPRSVDTEILKDKDPYYRVFDLSRNTYNDAVQAYFHKCVGGYSPSKMESYQDLIDVHLSGPYNGEVLNMLNTKYIIFNGGQNGEAVFQPNPNTCGNAWFVNSVKYVNNADEEMKAMNAPAIGDTVQMPNAWKAAQTAIIRNTFAPTLNNATSFNKDSAASIKLTQYGLDDLTFVSQNNQEGLGVFADIYYDKGWKAYIDGKESPIVKANYVLRALKIPAGKHTITFEFRPATYYKSNNLAMISSLLVYLLIGAAVFMTFKKEKTESTGTTV